MFRRRFRIPYVFSWAPLLVGNTAEVVSSFETTSSTELIPRNYYIHQVLYNIIYAGVLSKLYVAHTHTHTPVYCN